MQLDDFADDSPWKWLRANNQFVCGRSGKHKLRFQQHAELDDERSGDYCHHAGNIHVHIGEWFDQRESNVDNHLHAHGDQCHWLNHVCANRYGKHGKQTDDQLLHGQPHKYQFRFQQHVELDDKRSDDYCHHAGDIHVHIGERFYECESNGDDNLHAHRNQYLRLGHIHGNRHHHCVRRYVGDNNHFVPGRNTRRGVCGLHNSRRRRHSALRVFAKHGCHRLSAIA